ncbi:MAG: hypothetical protein PHI01_05170, partial [Candidatus Izemoplasmatales bacterium]|nr:hypothetical protein [Candidatus Izemoplasmatales bacterium]
MKKIRNFFDKIAELWRRFSVKANEKVLRPVAKAIGLSWLGKKLRKIPHRYKRMIYGLLFIMPWIIGIVLLG